MFFLFDIGGTKMRLAISKDGASFSDPQIVSTPQAFEEGVSLFGKVYSKITAGTEIKKTAGGIAGVFNREKTKLLKSPNLGGWIEKPLKERLEAITKGEVFLENDTDMAGLGEATVGAGRDHRIVVYMTISTGVGGSRIVNKKIDEYAFGFEPGHQIIDVDGTIYPELGREKGFGDLEDYISGGAVEKRFGKKPFEIHDEKVWDELARLLAYGLNNTIVHWSPDVVVLGGGMMKSPGISVERVKYHLKDILKIFPEHPEIKKAELGDFGGLHGAFAYLNQISK